MVDPSSLHDSLTEYASQMTIITSGNIAKIQDYILYLPDELHLDRNRNFNYSQFDKQVTIINDKLSKTDIIFKHCVFPFGVDLSQCTANVQFINTSILGELELNTKYVNSNIRIEKCDFPDNYELQVTSGHIVIHGSTIHKVKCSENCSKVNVLENSKIGTVEADNASGNFQRLHISKSNIDDLIFLNSNQEEAISKNGIILIHDKCRIDSISINASLRSFKMDDVEVNSCNMQNLEGYCDIEINACTITNFSAINSDIKGNFIFEYSIVRTLWLDRFNIYQKESDELEKDGILSLKSIKGINEAILCSISGVIVTLSELQIERLCLRHSDFKNWNISNIDWAKNFKLFLFESPYLRKKSVIDERIELINTSRELKKYFTGHENHLEADIFKVSELDTHFWYQLSRIKKWELNLKHWNQIPSSFNLLISFLVLGTNKIFSNYGRWVVVPLIWLFGVHFLWFYFLLTFNSLPYEICWGGEDCSIAYYLSLINPAHKLLDLNGNIVYSVVDFFMRVSSGYFIYYFLKASRKYSRN